MIARLYRGTWVGLAMAALVLSGCGDPSKSTVQQSLGGILFGTPNPQGINYQACVNVAAERGWTCEQLREWLRTTPVAASSSPSYGGQVPVSGYYRSNGTYVRPHTRTAPDGIRSNNRSSR